MPYAIYSKKTKVVSKIVHNLSSIIPSEEAIEVSDDISFTRGTWMPVFGQDITGQHVKLYSTGGGLTTISPFSTAYTAEGVPYKVKNVPTFVQPANGSDYYKKPMPIYAAPHSWKRWALLQAKYQAILARNNTYQGLVGEEFDSEKHIDSVGGINSANYTVLGNSCIIGPGGYVQSTFFRFGGNATDPGSEVEYVFDTYYFATQPELPPGIITTWGGELAAGGNIPLSDSAGETLYLNDESPTTIDGGETASPMVSMAVRFYNDTVLPITLENYMLFVRARNV